MVGMGSRFCPFSRYPGNEAWRAMTICPLCDASMETIWTCGGPIEHCPICQLAMSEPDLKECLG